MAHPDQLEMETKSAPCSVILEVLNKNNYGDWSVRVKTYLIAQELWDIIEGTTEPPKQADDEAVFKTWNKKNFMALHVIQNSCGPEAFYEIKKISSAKVAWDTLAEQFYLPKNTNSVVFKVLDKDNYVTWSNQIKAYLMVQDLWNTVEVTSEPPKQEDDEAAFKAWNKKNCMALHVIQNSCGPQSFPQIKEISLAKIAWNTLAGIYNMPNNPNSVVREVLEKSNYDDWRVRVKTYLMAQDLWNVIEAKTEAPKQDDEVAFKTWNKKNSVALDAIRNSCGLATFSEIKEINLAKTAWDTLAEKYSKSRNTNAGIDNDGNHISVEYAALYKAVLNGDCNSAMEFLDRRPDGMTANMTDFGQTALHVAISAGHVHIAKELVRRMAKEDLEARDTQGYTPLMESVMRGNRELAECMVIKNKNLLSIGIFSDGAVPVVMAISFGQIEMSHYLYPLTPEEDLMPQKDPIGADILLESIYTGNLDIALDLIQRCPRLALAVDRYGNSPLQTLASMPNAFPSGYRLSFCKRWIYSCIPIRSTHAIKEVRLSIPKVEERQRDHRRTIIGAVPALLSRLIANVFDFVGIKRLYQMKLMHVKFYELHRRICKAISETKLRTQQNPDGRIYDAVGRAVQNGIFEIVSEMLKADPRLEWTKDQKSRNIFALAILHRQPKIFNLIFELDLKNVYTCHRDKDGNNMLHIAGMLADPITLNRISGAALQMQRELQWYKEVESIVLPMIKEGRNMDNFTPRELFSQNHKALLKEGEKWMKGTATSCTVVGSLIITIMFAAVFTVPGGNNQETGLPIFLRDRSFRLFIIFDALSLFSSSTSVLMFLGILTSRYAEDDFLESLPRKMIIGLSTLFFSIAAMMVTFCAASWTVIDMALPIICSASIPVTLFVLLQFPLLVEMFISTYGPRILGRKQKYCWF